MIQVSEMRFLSVKVCTRLDSMRNYEVRENFFIFLIKAVTESCRERQEEILSETF
jgi:hypothetical protein